MPFFIPAKPESELPCAIAAIPFIDVVDTTHHSILPLPEKIFSP